MDNKNEIKEDLIIRFTTALPVLRASIGISQGELAEYIGVSRQTYCSLEQSKRPMSWNNFMALFMFFYANPDSKRLMESKQTFIREVYDFLQYNKDVSKLKEDSQR